MKKLQKDTITKLLGTIGTFCMVLSYIPQLYLTYTTRNVTGQSLVFWILLCVALTCIQWNAGSAYRANRIPQTFNIWIFQTINMILAYLMLVAVIIF